MKKHLDDGGSVLLVGISEEDYRQHLQAGQCIAINNDSHPMSLPKGMTLVLIFGKTENELWDTLVKEGVIPEVTNQ